MDADTNLTFMEWLDAEIDARGWNDYQLSKRAGLSHSVISKARGGVTPKWEACEAIAAALKLPTELVFRKAGLLPETSAEDLGLEEWKHLLSQLPEKDRFELIQIARMKLALQSQEQAPEGWRKDLSGAAGRRVEPDLPGSG